MKEKGIRFCEGLSASETDNIHRIYGIKFPEKLLEFYRLGVPYSENDYKFPRWKDFSAENIISIKKRIDAPLCWLANAVERYFWLNEWGERPDKTEEVMKKFETLSSLSPLLIPIYSHRYIPQIDGVADPPVISTVGEDTVCYGKDLENYLNKEFLGVNVIGQSGVNIPFWSDIIDRPIKSGSL